MFSKKMYTSPVLVDTNLNLFLTIEVNGGLGPPPKNVMTTILEINPQPDVKWNKMSRTSSGGKKNLKSEDIL